MIESLGACAGADKKPMESLHTSHIMHSQDCRGVGICSTNCSDVRRQFRKLGCLRLETIPESELCRLFCRFITDYDSVLMRISIAYVARFVALVIVMVLGRILCSHA